MVAPIPSEQKKDKRDKEEDTSPSNGKGDWAPEPASEQNDGKAATDSEGAGKVSCRLEVFEKVLRLILYSFPVSLLERPIRMRTSSRRALRRQEMARRTEGCVESLDRDASSSQRSPADFHDSY